MQAGAKDLKTRYAVFAFLAGFWRKDYRQDLANMNQTTLAVFGEEASSIDRSRLEETPPERVELYQKHLPQCKACIIPGRNVLPYENTEEFAQVTADFIAQL